MTVSAHARADDDCVRALCPMSPAVRQEDWDLPDLRQALPLPEGRHHAQGGRDRLCRPRRCGASQHGLSSNKMALITSDCVATRLLGHQMALITSGCVRQARPSTASGRTWLHTVRQTTHRLTPIGTTRHRTIQEDHLRTCITSIPYSVLPMGVSRWTTAARIQNKPRLRNGAELLCVLARADG